jgi:hypothetical protein
VSFAPLGCMWTWLLVDEGHRLFRKVDVYYTRVMVGVFDGYLQRRTARCAGVCNVATSIDGRLTALSVCLYDAQGYSSAHRGVCELRHEICNQILTCRAGRALSSYLRKHVT